ncbi:MAG: hypothetical protein HQ508_00730 [Candidatus Marinimicrobia bacterium]|nr:hypothetical protein [Candidatus Neomarinimicrobiota bacterium]
MFFKKKVDATEFGGDLIPVFSHWCNVSLNKAGQFGSLKDDEINGFQGLWLLALGELLPNAVKGAASIRVKEGYSKNLISLTQNLNIGDFVSSHSDKIIQLTSENQGHITGGHFSSYSEIILEFIYAEAFSSNSGITENVEDIVTRTLIDFGAAYRELSDLLGKSKLV